MKICMISGSWPPAACGIADAMPILLDLLAEEPGVQVHAITTKGYSNNPSKNIVFHNVVKHWNWRAYLPLEQLLKEIRPDIVHIQYSPKEYKKHPFINFLPFLLIRNGLPVVATVHEYTGNSFLGKIRLWPTFWGSDLILVPDMEYIPAIKKIARRARVEFIQVAPNIPPGQMNPTEKAQLRHHYLGDEHSLLLGFFGLVDANKIIIPILEALHQLKTKHHLLAKFLLIGKLVEKDRTSEEIKATIERYRLQEDCIITGYLHGARAADHLSILDFAIQIYRRGLSTRNASFLAAMSQNIKIITTASRHYLPHYPNVFVAQGGDKLAEQICAIILENRHKKIAFPTENFGDNTWRDLKEKHLQVYQSILGEDR